ncbi:DUF5694 domain-containing protein [Chryseobacterium taichungense]|uniref:DUF5694 domain-containing protein n=1 Tax=Chryseobacterium taichungense TaxID=295069 RepID=UPI0028A7BF7D|nr:DUF5694 domain-containing protein [Chryseobacterium taichungense]
MKIIHITLLTLTFAVSLQAQQFPFKDKLDDAVPVLNIATFHMGTTSDANTTAFDEHSAENKRRIHEVAKEIAAFRPTIIVVEELPEKNEKLRKAYLEYLDNPKKKYENPGEIELLAFEIGRLSHTSKIFGIDYKEGYDYSLYYHLKNKRDDKTYEQYGELVDAAEKKYPEDKMTFRQLFKLNNDSQMLDMLININADMLTYVSTKDGNEGADEAAKMYHRNLVMFSNFNKISINKNDRIILLMGGTHTAFFMDFLKRSPKYRPESVLKYVK